MEDGPVEAGQFTKHPAIVIVPKNFFSRMKRKSDSIRRLMGLIDLLFSLGENLIMFLKHRFSRPLRATAGLALFVLVITTLSFVADASTLTWNKLTPTKKLPPRASFASAYDPVSKKVVIFGGFNANQVLNETWTFDGTTWAEVKTSVAPSARASASMAYDRKIHKLVLFGGSSGLTLLNDTWLWDGATSRWTQANPKTVPAGASGPTLFTDPANGHTVMFGGNRGRFYSRDTFRWTGTNWTLLKPSTSPYPRSSAVHAVDPIRKNVVLFGGISDNWIVQNTWTWDGTNWTEQNPATQPPPLYRTSGGFDPVLKEVVVFGGGSVGADQNKTWAWDGTDWTRLSPAKHPSIREEFGTVWDPTSHQFLIFGGDVFNTTKFYGDTWELTGK
jgi:Galactose oxidase, central domain